MKYGNWVGGWVRGNEGGWGGSDGGSQDDSCHVRAFETTNLIALVMSTNLRHLN